MTITPDFLENEFAREGVSCPHCSRDITPDLLSVNELQEIHPENFESPVKLKVATLKCPTCKKPFLKYYGKTYFNMGEEVDFHEVHLSFRKKIKTDIPKLTADLSFQFVEIYEQSLLAKEYGLTHLLGPGYRKSVEFLIKDFAIKINPERTEKYLNMSINQVINEIFQDKIRLLNAAKSVFFLGNDLSHYNHRNIDKDVSDMERFIKVLLNEIETELTYLEQVDFVNPS